MYAHKILYMIGAAALGGAGAYGENPILIFASLAFMAGTALTFKEYEGCEDDDDDLDL